MMIVTLKRPDKKLCNTICYSCGVKMFEYQNSHE